MVTQQQLMEYSEAFSMYDLDGTGTIPVTQVEHVLRTLGQVVCPAILAALQQKKLDEGSQTITFQEFLVMMSSGNTLDGFEEDAATNRAGRLREALGLFDTSSSGTISVVDLRKALREVLKESEIDALIHMTDPKRTGKIDCSTLTATIVGA